MERWWASTRRLNWQGALPRPLSLLAPTAPDAALAALRPAHAALQAVQAAAVASKEASMEGSGEAHDSGAARAAGASTPSERVPMGPQN